MWLARDAHLVRSLDPLGGWVGAGYLVARTLDPDGKELGRYYKSSLVGRYGQD